MRDDAHSVRERLAAAEAALMNDDTLNKYRAEYKTASERAAQVFKRLTKEEQQRMRNDLYSQIADQNGAHITVRLCNLLRDNTMPEHEYPDIEDLLSVQALCEKALLTGNKDDISIALDAINSVGEQIYRARKTPAPDTSVPYTRI